MLGMLGGGENMSENLRACLHEPGAVKLGSELPPG